MYWKSEAPWISDCRRIINKHMVKVVIGYVFKKIIVLFSEYDCSGNAALLKWIVVEVPQNRWKCYERSQHGDLALRDVKWRSIQVPWYEPAVYKKNLQLSLGEIEKMWDQGSSIWIDIKEKSKEVCKICVRVFRWFGNCCKDYSDCGLPYPCGTNERVCESSAMAYWEHSDTGCDSGCDY